MARRHTLLAKSRLLEYSEIQASQIPAGTTVYEVSTLPSTVDETKVFIYVTSSEKYYRIKPKEPVQYDSSTADSGIMMGEPAVNMASGYEALFLHRYTSSGSGTQNDGLSVYKPITESVELNSSSMYTPTAQAVSDFVVPKLDSTTYTTSTPTITLHENTIYRCTNDGVTSMTINISDMVTGPKTRESVVYFHTGNNPSPIAITGGNASTVVFGDTDLMENQDYWVSVKDNTVTITTNLSNVAISGSYNDLLNKPDLNATLYESITYSQLKSKVDNSQLVKGKNYRITDYNTVVNLTNVSSAGHAFDIVVKAVSENELDHHASALLHDGDTYFSNAGAYLEKWQVWYDVDNNRDKYAWANTTTGKGVIYRLIDEYGNDCPYDFKNILFTKENVYTNVYTFNKFAKGDTDNSDLSLSSPYCYNNIIGPKITVRKATLNNIVFLNTSNISYCFNNTFGNDCTNNTFGNSCYGNTFGVSFNDNTTGLGFVYNTVGNNCANNVFQNNFRYGTLGNSCSNNNFYGNMNSVIVENFNRYIELRGVGGSTLQNVYIAQGCSGTSETYTDVRITRDLSYRTTVARDSNGNIRIYNEDDPVLPTVTSEDNGKILMVSDGAWTAQTVPVSDNVLY